MALVDPFDAFNKAFVAIQGRFTNRDTVVSGIPTFDYIKGLNIRVLATVAVMLLYGVGELDIERLYDDDLDDVMSNLDYGLFEPYILDIMDIDAKPKQLAKVKMFSGYQTMFVRYIYTLRTLNVAI